MHNLSKCLKNFKIENALYGNVHLTYSITTLDLKHFQKLAKSKA